MSAASRGFTLLEMAIAFLLMGIAAAVAVPAFTRLARHDAARPADALVELLHRARRMAIEHQVTVSLVLDPATGRYRADSTGMDGGGVVADSTLPVPSATTFAADSARATFLFRPTGAAIADRVTVRDGEATEAVVVDPWTGVAGAWER